MICYLICPPDRFTTSVVDFNKIADELRTLVEDEYMYKMTRVASADPYTEVAIATSKNAGAFMEPVNATVVVRAL